MKIKDSIKRYFSTSFIFMVILIYVLFTLSVSLGRTEKKQPPPFFNMTQEQVEKVKAEIRTAYEDFKKILLASLNRSFDELTEEEKQKIKSVYRLLSGFPHRIFVRAALSTETDNSTGVVLLDMKYTVPEKFNVVIVESAFPSTFSFMTLTLLREMTDNAENVGFAYALVGISFTERHISEIEKRTKEQACFIYNTFPVIKVTAKGEEIKMLPDRLDGLIQCPVFRLEKHLMEMIPHHMRYSLDDASEKELNQIREKAKKLPGGFSEKFLGITSWISAGLSLPEDKGAFIFYEINRNLILWLDKEFGEKGRKLLKLKKL